MLIAIACGSLQMGSSPHSALLPYNDYVKLQFALPVSVPLSDEWIKGSQQTLYLLSTFAELFVLLILYSCRSICHNQWELKTMTG